MYTMILPFEHKLQKRVYNQNIGEWEWVTQIHKGYTTVVTYSYIDEY